MPLLPAAKHNAFQSPIHPTAVHQLIFISRDATALHLVEKFQ